MSDYNINDECISVEKLMENCGDSIANIDSPIGYW